MSTLTTEKLLSSNARGGNADNTNEASPLSVNSAHFFQNINKGDQCVKRKSEQAEGKQFKGQEEENSGCIDREQK